jgi:16S rRNA G527 N7-methylase RsmG
MIVDLDLIFDRGDGNVMNCSIGSGAGLGPGAMLFISRPSLEVEVE